MARHWLVQIGSRVEQLTEQKLRELLRKGQLTGLELVRAQGADDWIPLWSLWLYRDEVATTAERAPATAAWKIVRWAYAHMALWVVVGTFFEWPANMEKWLVLVGLHVAWAASRTYSAVLAQRPYREARERSRAGQTLPAEDPSPHRLLTSSTYNDADDPYVEAVTDALTALGRAAPKVGALPDVHELRRGVLTLHAQRLEMASLAPRDVLETLETELKSTDERLRSAQGALKTDLLVQRHALKERLDATRTSAILAERLQVREDTLLHQIEALRLATAQALAGSNEVPDLASRLKDLKEKAKAEDEVVAAIEQARALRVVSGPTSTNAPTERAVPGAAGRRFKA